ncbi:MAG: GNAT family N-acetyltransferase [Cypionkella sp.]|jgi:ribosomal-protein-alanine N-acetyltransferase|nr:GNAT family N-acetyltransferase [Cypionkella sp.]
MPDPARLAALHAACFTLPRPWSTSEIAALQASPHVFTLCESGGFLMGRAVAGEAELLTLAVAPELRRSGIGTRLLMGFLDGAKCRGATRAFLEVAAGNHAALSLYTRTGFAEAGRRKAYYTGLDGSSDDALVLVRDL